MKYIFTDEEQKQINEIKKSVEAQAEHALRKVLAIPKRLSKKVKTDSVDEFGNTIENWDKVSTKELINIFSEANAWNFYSSPIKMQAFIESSLAEIIRQASYDKALLGEEGTVAEKTARAEVKTLDAHFAATYKKLYSQYITDVLRSFDTYVKRLEKIIDYRQKEEQFRKSPFEHQ